VVGGAETAVEAAGEIKATWPRADVAMLSSRRCGEFKGARVGAVVRDELERLGVRLIDGVNAVEVTEQGVLSATGLIPCDVCVWAGGLCGSPIAPAAGLGTDQRDRIWVDPNLRSITHPHIFAIGDAARPIAPTGAPYRLSALAAAASGAYVADVIRAGLRHRRLSPFSFSTYGQGIAIGRSGVGFTSYPDDEAAGFSIVRGRAAYHIRNLFVWFFSFALKLERKLPGAFPIVGRHRVSWQRAEDAMRAGPPGALGGKFRRKSV
jgi:NADH dehydrogenase FAD-containing subunit